MEKVVSPLKVGLPAADGSEAFLHVYPAPQPAGLALLLCPGGGFRQVALTHEGTAFAPWLNERGVTCAVLEYRMPEGHADRPADDVRSAIRLLRSRAGNWGATRVGVMGFSIGGHLAATAATCFSGAERPDFQVLAYPVISMTDELTHRPSRERLLGTAPAPADVERLSLELHVTSEVPPTLLALCADDAAVSPRNSLRYAEELSRFGVPFSLYVYPDGGHSFGFREDFPYREAWLSALSAFLSGR